MYTGFWWRNLSEQDSLGNLGVRFEDNIKTELVLGLVYGQKSFRTWTVCRPLFTL